MNQPNRDHFKNIFYFMKSKGLFQQFQTYEDYEKHTSPAPEQETLEKTIQAQQEKNDAPTEDRDTYRDSLGEQEKIDYDTAFNS